MENMVNETVVEAGIEMAEQVAKKSTSKILICAGIGVVIGFAAAKYVKKRAAKKAEVEEPVTEETEETEKENTEE